MSQTSFSFCKALSSELDPEKLQQKFLSSLLELQNLERGSIWVKKTDGYLCVEAVGDQSEKIKGITISANRPSIVGWVIENGKMTIAEPGKDERHYKEFEADMAVKSKLILCFPLFLKGGEVYGAVQLIDTRSGGSRLNLDQDYLELLQNLVDIGSIVLSNSLVYSAQVQENLKLKQTLESIRREEPILGESEAFLKILKVASDYAKTDFPVLITGESGTGKEVIAKEIHRLSNRMDKPFLVQNCSAIPETLLESELFGYQKGAFTGAVKDKVGLFEAANGGTVFLDEIGDMPLQLQARILRVLQNSEIKPLGGTKTKKIDVRIISATNKDLKEAIAKEQFREDLFYRLNVLPLHLPALRERKEDILLLLDHFLSRESFKMGIPPKKFSKDALDYLIKYSWKGNIRELENFVKHIIVVVEGEKITLDDLSLHFPPAQLAPPEEEKPVDGNRGEETEKPSPGGASFFDGYSWEELERAYVLYLLEKNRWHITRAAKEAKVNRSTFDSRMKKLGIRK
ncbi:sigma-54-dependent Fis family transcriptional regulator [Desulforhabdus amnigena]|uniref:Acetoacetate metabolism regulatory protein AtoC n=1 Tax=Desulforhabdus amnigena TaxID=40218 RepID=A0A9W6FUX9_9BACT|nr:sigma-54-dependent Fis family transcriptional regulator [Desulforhabdus amnigena]GLI35366.1 acetoacetate metabolism regulatory protein AtoC [Desulforhabdus amnigena]